MFLIDYVKPEDAQETIADFYGLFPPQMGVPHTIQIYSASPELLERQGEFLKYFISHPNMDFPVLAAIRYLGAKHFNLKYCTRVNAGLLKSTGVTNDELKKLATNPDVIFEEKDTALLLFVIKSLKDPEAVDQSDIDEARAVGWADSDLFDATALAAQMSSVGHLFKTFTKEHSEGRSVVLGLLSHSLLSTLAPASLVRYKFSNNNFQLSNKRGFSWRSYSALPKNRELPEKMARWTSG